MLLLGGGEFEAGWAEWESRWRDRNSSNYREHRNFRQPLWLGERSIAGRTILLYGEQGLGDTLQFCRYVPLVARLGGRVMLEVSQPLIRVLSGLEGVSELLAMGSPLPDFDYHCPLMSLPRVFSTRIESIPSASGYIAADPALVESWQAKLGPKRRPRIGLAWSGSRGTGMTVVAVYRWQSCSRTFQSTFNTSACRRICAARICGCCADALGQSTWVLLPFHADWRWLRERLDSPWYASVRLYRQSRPGDWSGPLERIQADLLHRFAGA
jgi:hypothetical protein